MGSPHRVLFRKQLGDPTTSLDGLNCTCAAAAMAVDRATLGQIRIWGGQVRARTGDTSGGTNLGQMATAVTHWSVILETRYGAPLSFLYEQLRAGRGAIVQGASAATKGTRWSASESFVGNHAWWVNEGRGWDTLGRPSEVLVYDPLADGRRAGIARSPFWLPRYYLERFAALLTIYGTTRLGAGRVYAAFTRDTEPHVHLRYGGRPMTTLPNNVLIAAGSRRANVRAGPLTGYDVVETLPTGATFLIWQYADTKAPAGSTDRRWYGDHQGTRWVHRSNIRVRR